MVDTRADEQSSLELHQLSNMGLFRSRRDYQPVPEDTDQDDQTIQDESEGGEIELESPFSWVEYAIFLLLGIAMLWAWYMSPPPIFAGKQL